jgi:hypothetical protein
MASTYKVLGQVDLQAATLTTLYTVPSATEAVISSVIICNRGTAATTFRLAVRPNGASIADQHYIAYDVPIAASDATTLTLGLTLDAADVLSVNAAGTASRLSFNAFGAEVTV